MKQIFITLFLIFLFTFLPYSASSEGVDSLITETSSYQEVISEPVLEFSQDFIESEPEPETIPEIIPDPVVTKEVILTSDMKKIVRAGDKITLTAHLSGIEPTDILKIQWQNNKNNEWTNIDTDAQLEFSFNASKENANWSWRIIILVKG